MNRDEDQWVVMEPKQQGLSISSVWDLVHASYDYSAVTPTLTKMLRRVSDYDVKEGIVRALSVKSARDVAFDILIDTLEELYGDTSPRSEELKWAIGNALSVQATRDDGEQLTALIRRRESGGARQMITFAIGRIKYRPAAPVLMSLLDDPDVAAQAASALGKMRIAQARERLERLAAEATGLAKKEAKKALERLDVQVG